MNWKTIITAGSMILLTGTLYAQATPDGETLATEDVCDVLHDATPGLYGLCVRYCEAQYSDELDSLEFTNSQIQILENYNRKKTYNDRYMPCYKGCPCFSVEDAELIASHQNFYRCRDFIGKEVLETWYESWQGRWANLMQRAKPKFLAAFMH